MLSQPRAHRMLACIETIFPYRLGPELEKNDQARPIVQTFEVLSTASIRRTQLYSVRRECRLRDGVMAGLMQADQFGS